MRNISSNTSRVVRLLLLGICLLLLTSTAEAYTIVLRGGRVLEIPNSFTVTPTTVTYEVSPGIQISLQLGTIDIPATEKANREPAGSLLSRIQKIKAGSIQKSETRVKQQKSRTVTNRDLESFARTRRESEVAYERRRQELGLPSLEEARRQALAEATSERQRFEQNQTEERATEAYWRERAVALKAEIAAADAEINSLRQQLAWLFPANGLASAAVVTGVAPFAGFGRSAVNPALLSGQFPPGVFVQPQWGQFNAQSHLASGMSPRVFASPGVFPRSGVRRPFISPFAFFPGVTGFGYQPYDLSYERTVLVTRLDELIAQRAGLEARWRALEDEARRAGAFPGWLRP